MDKKIDFTCGSVGAKLLAFSCPVLGANLLQSVDQVVDMLVVGAFVGERGLAALSNATMVGFVANALALGLAGATTVLVASRLGASDESGAARAARVALVLAAACSLALAVPLLCAAPALFAALGTPWESMAEAVGYAVVWAAGLPGSFLLAAAGGVMRARGDARTPLVLATCVAVANCLGGPVFVGAGLGCAGTAWASSVAGTLAAAAALALLGRPHDPRGAHAFWSARPRAVDLAELLRLAAPLAFQQVVVNLSWLAVTSMTNSFGVDVVAGAGAAQKVNTLAGMPVWAVGSAVQAAAAQCAGAGDAPRAVLCARVGLVAGLAATGATLVAVQAAAPQLVGLFAAEPAAQAAGALYLRVCCSLNGLVYAALYLFDSFAAATGAARLAAANALLEALVGRLGLAALLVGTWGYPGILAAQALSAVLPCALGAVYLARYARRARCARGTRRRS